MGAGRVGTQERPGVGARGDNGGRDATPGTGSQRGSGSQKPRLPSESPMVQASLTLVVGGGENMYEMCGMRILLK